MSVRLLHGQVDEVGTFSCRCCGARVRLSERPRSLATIPVGQVFGVLCQDCAVNADCLAFSRARAARWDHLTVATVPAS